MKLSIILLVGAFFQMQAETGLGQDNRISLDLHSVTIHQVIETIESKSDFRFFYSREELDLGRTISIGLRKVKMKDALDAIFKNTDIQYKILEYQIVLTRKPVIELKTIGFQDNIPHLSKLLPLRFETLIPVFSITGTVTDVEGEPLIGVNIQVKGTNKGTSTDLEGHFVLNDIDENATLVVSYIGYETQEVSVSGETSLSITLVTDSQLLDEVVVVGYGTMKKINLTGAVDVITNENIENRQSSTVSQILQGQSPGLNFSVGANGFEPGASMNIDIRGMGSLNGGSPFVVIDGFPGSMDRLNPNDIESISILKDAAASAIYGARAPYGVILITTKSGRKNEKLSISYSGNMSINTPDRLPEMLDSYVFSRVVNEMGSNGGGRPYSEEAVDRVIAFKNQDWAYLKQFYPADATYFEAMPQTNGRWGNNNNAHANYDWYDEFYGNSLNQQHNISVRGGSDKSAYYLSAGFVEQEGVLNYGTDTYQRYNLSGKVNTSLTDWWDLKYETRFMKSPREYPTILRNWGYQMIFRQIPRTVPTEAKYTGNGEYTIQSKIPFIEDSGTNLETTTENWHTMGTEIRPAKGWKINGEFAYRSVGFTAANLNLTFYEQLVDGSYIPNAQSVPNSIQKIQNNNFYWTSNLYTSYNVTMSKHSVLVLAGTQFELNKSNQLNATKTNLIVPEVPSLQTSNGEAVVSENLGHWSTNGYFGRLTYNYDEKYLFEANARYDGTSRFQRGRRWGFFPSFSVGWNLDRESFWENIQNHVNVFKIRASWGQLGNQQVSPYQDISLIPLQSGMLNWLWSYGSSRPLGYTGTPGLVSPYLTWETATSKNLGLNLAFLDNRLQVDFDLFERITDNMIGPSEPVPGVLGSNVPSSNNAVLRTRGWESAVRWKSSFRNSGLSYFLNLNIYDAQSEVMEYLNPTGLVSNWYAGKKAGEIWGYTARDLFKSQEEIDSYLEKVDMSYIFNTWNPGDVKYEDINGDGRIDNGSNSLSNHGDLSVIGNETPRYQFGISAGLSFKGFDVSFLVKGTAKRDYSVGPGGENYMFWGMRNWLFTSLTPQHLDYFRDQPGDKYTGLYEGDANINIDSYWPRPYLETNQNAKNRQHTTRYLVDASYVRLQNVQLGFALPQRILTRLNLEKVRIFISGENIWTITDLLRGIDPIALGTDSRFGMTYRADKMFSVGINATL